MDLNIKIIEGVKQYPCLYNSQINLEERNQSWKQLAEKLKMHEMHIKIRWHSLVQGYQRDENFKYAKLMRFVPRIIVKQPKAENWPEFIITEEDLKDDRNSTQEQDEFVFLEIDEAENKMMETKPRVYKDKVIDCKEITKQIEEIPKEKINNEESCIEAIKEEQNEQIKKTNKLVEMPSPSVTSKVEEKMAAVDVNKNNEVFIEEPNQMLEEKPQPLVSERCEDVIFGELVSAMLKRMDENKKKNIKKEIMNLLFS